MSNMSPKNRKASAKAPTVRKVPKNRKRDLHENERPVGTVTVHVQDREVIYFLVREMATFTVNGEQGAILNTMNGTTLVRFRGKQYAVHSQDVVKAVMESLGIDTSDGES